MLPPGEAFLNYYGPRGTIPAISYSKLMGLDGAIHPGALQGKVVFVGLFTDIAGPSSAADVFKTPYSSFGGRRDYGVELHAAAAANLLDRSWIKKPAQEWLWTCIFLIAAVIMLANVKVKSAALFITALWLLCPAASYFAFLHHYWLSVFCPLLALSAGYLGWALFDSDTRAKESEHSFLRFRTSLGKYLPRGIINAMSKENFDPVSERNDLEEGLYLIFNALQQRESSDVLEDLEQVKVIDGDYRIQRVLWKGAMAVVMLVFDAVSEEELALKLTRIEDPEQAGAGDGQEANEQSPDEGESAEDREEAAWRKKRMFRAEVQRLMELNHPRVVRIHNYGCHGKMYYLAMDYMRGGSLKDRMKARPLILIEVLQCLTQALEGLSYMHSRGVIHRDIKPDNILLTDGAALIGPENPIKLTDFGVARVRCVEEKGVIVGTPFYMAPEMFIDGGRADEKSDVYSLGLTVYELLTGKILFFADNFKALAMNRAMQDVPPIPGVEGWINHLLKWMLERTRPKRPTAEEALQFIRENEGRHEEEREPTRLAEW